MNGQVLTAKGSGAKVSFDGNVISITRNALSRHDSGTRSIPISRISGVEVSKPSQAKGRLGAFTINIPGASEARTWFGHGRRKNSTNENTVEFASRKHLRQFEEIRDAVMAAL